MDLDWKLIAYQLWRILDNIDTAGDVAKDDDEAYRALVEKCQKKRWEVIDEREVQKLYDKFYIQEDGGSGL
jgi:hypothetical protein